MESQWVIKRPLHTEKSVANIAQNNTYFFEVDGRASKAEIKEAVEELFEGVKVLSVRTAWKRGKERRLRWERGRTADRKKAMVKLRPGDTIDIGY